MVCVCLIYCFFYCVWLVIVVFLVGFSLRCCTGFAWMFAMFNSVVYILIIWI